MINFKKIEENIGRNLKMEEKFMIINYLNELKINNKLKNLYNICNEKNLYCPKLTSNDGNCLFESLVYNNIGLSVKDLRVGIAKLMYIFKNIKNLFETREETLEEIFMNTNEIEYVYNKVNNIKGENNYVK